MNWRVIKGAFFVIKHFIHSNKFGRMFQLNKRKGKPKVLKIFDS